MVNKKIIALGREPIIAPSFSFVPSEKCDVYDLPGFRLIISALNSDVGLNQSQILSIQASLNTVSDINAYVDEFNNTILHLIVMESMPIVRDMAKRINTLKQQSELLNTKERGLMNQANYVRSTIPNEEALDHLVSERHRVEVDIDRANVHRFSTRVFRPGSNKRRNISGIDLHGARQYLERIDSEILNNKRRRTKAMQNLDDYDQELRALSVNWDMFEQKKTSLIQAKKLMYSNFTAIIDMLDEASINFGQKNNNGETAYDVYTHHILETLTPVARDYFVRHRNYLAWPRTQSYIHDGHRDLLQRSIIRNKKLLMHTCFQQNNLVIRAVKCKKNQILTDLLGYEVSQKFLNTRAGVGESCTPIFFAVDDIDMFKQLHLAGSNLFYKDISDNCLIHAASERGSLAVVKYLLSNGSEFDLKRANKYHKKPMDLAIQNRKWDIVEYFFSREDFFCSEDPEIVTKNISNLIVNNMFEYISRIFAEGVEVTERGGADLICSVISKESVDINVIFLAVEQLCDAGANPNTLPNGVIFDVIFSLGDPSARIIRKLVHHNRSGINTRASHVSGRAYDAGYGDFTPLHLAVYLGYENVVSALVDAPGIDLNLVVRYGYPFTSWKGYSALDIAKKRGFMEIEQILQRHDAQKAPESCRVM